MDEWVEMKEVENWLFIAITAQKSSSDHSVWLIYVQQDCIKIFLHFLKMFFPIAQWVVEDPPSPPPPQKKVT